MQPNQSPDILCFLMDHHRKNLFRLLYLFQLLMTIEILIKS